MIYLVTGGAGFIGSHIVEEIVRNGGKVIILDDFSKGTIENLKGVIKRVKIIKGSITNKNAIKEAMKNIDYIIHLAAVSSAPDASKNPERTYKINVEGTRNILEAVPYKGIRRFIFISSASVYKENKNKVYKEEDKKEPKTIYGKSKLKAEEICLNYASKKRISLIILRYFNVFGPRDIKKSGRIIPSWLDNIKKGKEIEIYGDGKQTRDFIYIKDIVEATLLSCKKEGINKEILNIGTGKPYSILELKMKIEEIMGYKLKVRSKKKRRNDIKHLIADISKAESILGFKPKTSLSNGLRETIAKELGILQ